MSTVAELNWDPYNAAFVRDPYPIFNRLREEMPLYRNDKHDFYAVTRYADCQRGLTDWQTYTSRRGDILDLIRQNNDFPAGTLIFEDPPVHDIHRRLLVRIFTPRRIAMLEPQVRAYCRRALEPILGSDRFDLVEAVSAEMPMRVIGMLLGIPESDQSAIRDQTNAALATEDGQPMTSQGVPVFEVFKDYIQWRKKNPSDDLMTELMTTEFEDETGVRRTLTDIEVLTYCTVVAGAGNETTGRLIGWFGALMARHPRQRQELVDDPSLIPNAIEEVLRFEPTGPFTARYVTQDVTLYDQIVPAGSAMLFILAAANRDPRRYANPDRFDIHRTAQQLTFGGGVHYCLGAALARLEGKIAAEEILKSFPNWDVDWDHAELANTSTVRGWQTLPLLIRR
jgi:cytochrome P450